MDKLYTPGTIRRIIENHGFRLSKSLGQNFLADRNIIDKIIEGSLIGERDLVIEIGPGIGVLTEAAAARAGKVIAVEIDSRLIPILNETLSDFDNVEILNQDILKTDLCKLIADNPGFDTVRIIGNLPYYITTPIVMKILEDKVPADSITIMLQKEVADRIRANPGTRDYGALSVAVQYYCTVEIVAHASREVFIPKPNVDSSVIRLDIRKARAAAPRDEAIFFAAVKAAFGQRRKTLLNALSGVCGLAKDEIGQVLNEAAIEPERRGETLSIAEYARLADTIFDHLQIHKKTQIIV